jgi:ribosomal protein S3
MTTRTANGARVRVTGRLTASDMGRLEHACADALLSRALRLQIDVSRVTETDQTAAAILQRLANRGALIIGGIGSLP